jgi:hypothetical protein
MKTEQLVDSFGSLMNKRVISSDLKELGNIISIDKDLLTILRGESHYIIPKSRVAAFTCDSDVVVDFRLNDLMLVELASLSYID